MSESIAESNFQLPEWVDVPNREKRRIYYFPVVKDGVVYWSSFEVKNVAAVTECRAGGHHLETEDGKQLVVKDDWAAVEFELYEDDDEYSGS